MLGSFPWSRSDRLVKAVKAGQTDKVRRLLETGADPNVRDQSGVPVVMFPVRECQADILNMLLQAGADPNLLIQETVSGMPVGTCAANVMDVAKAMGPAAENFTAKQLTAMAEEASRVVDEQPRAPKGSTALMVAATLGHERILQDLMEAGATIDTENAQGATALMMAAARDHIGCVRALLEGGGNPNSTVGFVAPLVQAVISGNTEIANTLLEAGGAPEATLKRAFEEAAFRGLPEMIDILSRKLR